MSRSFFGRMGLFGDGGGVDDADVRALELGGDVRLLGARHEVVEDGLGGVDLLLARVVGDGAAAEVERLLLGGLEGGVDARLLGGGGLVVVLRGADDVLGLGADLGAGLRDLVADLHAPRGAGRGSARGAAPAGARGWRARSCRFWTTPLRMTSGSSSGLAALAIWRQRASFWSRSVFRSLRAVPSSLRRWSRRVRRSSMLTRPSCLLERLELAVELLDLAALLVDLGAEPVAGLGGGLEAQVEALRDVEVGEGVRGGGGELGAAARDGDGDEAAVADRADAEPVAGRRRSPAPSRGSGPGAGRGWRRSAPCRAGRRTRGRSGGRAGRPRACARLRLWSSLYCVW